MSAATGGMMGAGSTGHADWRFIQTPSRCRIGVTPEVTLDATPEVTPEVRI